MALTKILYDRELAVSERKVNPADIVRDSNLILGKYTIHVLPEGYGILRADLCTRALIMFQIRHHKSRWSVILSGSLLETIHHDPHSNQSDSSSSD